MGKCFVIQPFDNAEYDKRYEGTFKPAIQEANLEPYRIDRDPGVSIPINDIQTEIRNADVCLAEITTNNPNVWFELGYAIARYKEVILVCSAERGEKFPFDIQHRSIIQYKTESKQDFEELQQNVTRKLKAILQKKETLDRMVDMPPIADTEGLMQHEMTTLVTIAENVDAPSDKVSPYTIKEDMQRAGFNKIATTLALTMLLKKGMIISEIDCDINGNDFFLYTITNNGMEWLLKNQDKLVLKEKRHEPKLSSYPSSDDIPF